MNLKQLLTILYKKIILVTLGNVFLLPTLQMLFYFYWDPNPSHSVLQNLHQFIFLLKVTFLIFCSGGKSNIFSLYLLFFISSYFHDFQGLYLVMAPP